MRRVYFVVEGHTEAEFVMQVLAPYLMDQGIYDVRAILIETSQGFKGGFVNYAHMRNLLIRLLKEEPDVLVTTFVDYFRMPTKMPGYTLCMKQGNVSGKIECLEENMKNDIEIEIGRPLFIPYIQQHEFEALLFSSNSGFEAWYDEEIFSQTKEIIRRYPNPEEINDGPETAPSKRLSKIITNYEKNADGPLIAIEIGVEVILQKCPRFRKWVEELILKARD